VIPSAVLKAEGLVNLLAPGCAETVGECSRCKKLNGDDHAIVEEWYTSGTLPGRDLAQLCDDCFAELQRWLDDGGK